MAVKLCTKTVRHLQKILKPPNNWIRVGVVGGGCNGFKYVITPTDEEPEKKDEVLLTNPPVYVCGASIMKLLGSELKWTEDALGARIEFVNPNAAGSCGCGESFS